MAKQVKIIVSFSAFMSLFMIAPMAFMLADNQPPYEYDADGSYVVPNKTPSGNQIRVHWKFKSVNRICSGSITRSIVDVKTKERITYDPTIASTTVELGDKALDRTFFLPSGITRGEKEYYADAAFACNPLQRFFPLHVRTPRLRFFVQ